MPDSGRVPSFRGERKKKKGKRKKIHVSVVSRLVTFYRLYGRKIKLMERREEGGLTEKEKARNEEERVTESKRLFSKLVRQFYYRVIKKKVKKR